jgi:hypothetical protein
MAQPDPEIAITQPLSEWNRVFAAIGKMAIETHLDLYMGMRQQAERGVQAWQAEQMKSSEAATEGSRQAAAEGSRQAATEAAPPPPKVNGEARV